MHNRWSVEAYTRSLVLCRCSIGTADAILEKKVFHQVRLDHGCLFGAWDPTCICLLSPCNPIYTFWQRCWMQDRLEILVEYLNWQRCVKHCRVWFLNILRHGCPIWATCDPISIKVGISNILLLNARSIQEAKEKCELVKRCDICLFQLWQVFQIDRRSIHIVTL